MIKVSVDRRVEKILDGFSKIEQSRIARTVKLFQDSGFLLDQRYLKKLTNKIWELRPGLKIFTAGG